MSASLIYRRSNPFRSTNIRPGANRFVFSNDASIDGLHGALRHHRQSQIVGPHGSGKSTLMVTILGHVRRCGWSVAHYVLDARRAVAHRPTERLREWNAALPECDLVAIDCFEQLSRWQRNSVARHCRALGRNLLVTSHREMGLADLYRTHVDVEIAMGVITEICQRERLVGQIPSRNHVAALLSRCRGNLRETLFALYDEHRLNPI